MSKFGDLTLDDLPEIAQRLGEMKYEIGDNRVFHAAVLKFVSTVDKAMADWEFTAKLFLRLQALFDMLEEIEAEQYGHQTTQGFLRLLTRLDDLGPEGETARVHFSKFSSIAEMARRFVITEDG